MNKQGLAITKENDKFNKIVALVIIIFIIAIIGICSAINRNQDLSQYESPRYENEKQQKEFQDVVNKEYQEWYNSR